MLIKNWEKMDVRRSANQGHIFSMSSIQGQSLSDHDIVYQLKVVIYLNTKYIVH